MTPAGSRSQESLVPPGQAVDAVDLARILGVAGTALLVLDACGNVLLANEPVGALLGVGESSLLGYRVDERLVTLSELLELRSRGQTHRAVRSFERTGSDTRMVESTSTRIADPGVGEGTPAFVVVSKDVTAFEAMRVERDRLMQLAAVSDALPSLLHELKNPLAAITSAVELVLEELNEGAARDDLQSVLGEIRRMKLTMEGIGSVGRQLASPNSAAIDWAITEAFHVLLRSGTSRGIAMECHVPAMPLLPFDPAAVRAIVFNLMQNAIHACEGRGATIRVSADYDRSAREMVLSVVDGGVGMTPEVLGRCTDLFYTTKSHGSGIGLALVKRAVERAEGRLAVSSELGRGTHVEIRLPVRERSGVHPLHLRRS